MKLITLLCLVAITQPVFCHSNVKDDKYITSDKKVPKIGYLVVVKQDKKAYHEKFESLEHVYTYISVFDVNFCADIEGALKDSPAFFQTNYVSEIYVEKKRITESGKYKRIRYSKSY